MSKIGNARRWLTLSEESEQKRPEDDSYHDEFDPLPEELEDDISTEEVDKAQDALEAEDEARIALENYRDAFEYYDANVLTKASTGFEAYKEKYGRDPLNGETVSLESVGSVIKAAYEAVVAAIKAAVKAITDFYTNFVGRFGAIAAEVRGLAGMVSALSRRHHNAVISTEHEINVGGKELLFTEGRYTPNPESVTTVTSYITGVYVPTVTGAIGKLASSIASQDGISREQLTQSTNALVDLVSGHMARVDSGSEDSEHRWIGKLPGNYTLYFVVPKNVQSLGDALRPRLDRLKGAKPAPATHHVKVMSPKEIERYLKSVEEGVHKVIDTATKASFRYANAFRDADKVPTTPDNRKALTVIRRANEMLTSGVPGLLTKCSQILNAQVKLANLHYSEAKRILEKSD